MRELNDLIRDNVRRLKPYSSARDEFDGEASVFLDANENPWNAPYNRYPDPMQRRLKERISEIKGVAMESIFLGNGSDEAIDIIFRAFCEPGLDNVVSIIPSYGMYQVCAEVNNVEFRVVPLKGDFSLDADALLAATDWRTKVIFLCSPNNPSGNSLNRDDIYRVLGSFDGIVVVDEAYIDFSSSPSYITELSRFPRLVVLQTLSKAWGAAAIRLGMAFASPEIIAVINKIKYPYNVNLLTQEMALEILQDEKCKMKQVKMILEERSAMAEALSGEPFNYHVYSSDANFLLVDVGDANRVYRWLLDDDIVTRNRNSVCGCVGCLRITIGTADENRRLFESLRRFVDINTVER